MKNSKLTKLLALFLAMTLVLSACAGSTTTTTTTTSDSAAATESGDTAATATTESTAASGKTSISIGLAENVVKLDPADTTGGTDTIKNQMIFQALVETDHQGNYTPLLAKEWEHDETNTVWTFYLQEGVTFHNGEAFTSADVVTTYQRLLDYSDSLQDALTYWTALESVEAIDDYTVQITTTEPLAAFLLNVSVTSIIPDEAYAEYGQDLFDKQLMYGTGPWVFSEWVDGQHLIMTYNENYWGDYDPSIDTVTLRFISEASSAISAHVSGDIDMYIVSGGIPTDMLPLYSGSEDTTEIITNSVGMFTYLQFHCTDDSIFSDANLREAVSLAINRESLVTDLIGGGKVLSSIITDACVGYDSSMDTYEYDLARAQELVANSDYNGEPIELITSSDWSRFEDILLVISEAMNEAGFNTSVNAMEFATFAEQRSQGDYEMLLAMDYHQGGDPSKFVSQKVVSDAHKHEYPDPEFYTLGTTILTELDTEVRNQAISDLANMVCDNSGPFVGLFQYEANFAINYGVTGYNLFPDGLYAFTYIDYAG